MLTQAIEPPLITIRPGTFVMGATADDKFATAQERPAHTVTFTRPFALGRYPVTIGQWNAYAPAPAPAPGNVPGSNDLPIMGVSYDDVQGYLAWLRNATGKPFRLPSEAEWEYACRAGTTGVFYTGNSISLADANYLYDEQGNCIGLGRPTPVGAYPPNPWGLHDMLGNVRELVDDPWRPDYCNGPVTADRVVRGGAWDYMPRLLRCAYRDHIPGNARLDNVGFRVACDVNV